jgi:4-amino-4-deoxy-L-arabinose transferase-like glycosyltransferase
MEKMAHLIPLKVPKNGWLGLFKEKLLSPNSLIVFLILSLASFLRLYRISDYLTFLGDEGRDVLVVKHLLEGDLTLLGPRASAGDFFLGPIYYYFMAPFLWLFNFDPVGPAIMIGLSGIATTFLVYWIGKEFFGQKAGIFASILFAVSPLVLAYSRSSWNPNLMPFVTLLMLYILYQAVSKNSNKLFILVGILYGIAMQLHYIEVFVAPIIFFFILIGKFLVAQKQKIKSLLLHYLSVALGFLIGWSPFLAFEFLHNFPNLRAISSFIFDSTDEGHVGNTFTGVISQVFVRVFGRLIYRFPLQEQAPSIQRLESFPWNYIVLLTAFISIILLFRVKNKLATVLLALWLGFGIVLFGYYKKPIYDYYFAFLFPLPFLLLGNALEQIYSLKYFKLGSKVIVIAFIAWLVYFNLKGAPFNYPANKQKDQMRTISEFVLSKTNGKPFNFALITPGNSDHAYRYYFELNNNSPITILPYDVDPDRKSVTDQLLIVCEMPDCKPHGNPLWEVAGFGRGEIDGKWKVSVVEVYKIRHYTGKE